MMTGNDSLGLNFKLTSRADGVKTCVSHQSREYTLDWEWEGSREGFSKELSLN